MFDISRLKPLTYAEWPQVRDIFVPVELPDGGGSMETVIDEAICYTGQHTARRLMNPDDAELSSTIVSLLTKAHINVIDGKKRFLIEAKESRFRAQLGKSASGHDLALRVIPQSCPRLDDLRLPLGLRKLLLGQKLLDGGLILIVAPHGQGKTTTTSATLASRLEAFGGYAQTIEDPCELPLQGVWGDGVCIQRPADVQPGDHTPGDGFYRSLVDSMRQFPAITMGTQLFVGEIQDSRTAVETLKAALHGHLVLATLHARSPADAIRRLATMCAEGSESLDMELTRESLAAALKGVWYQTLSWDREAEGWKRGQLSGQILWPDASQNVVKLITEGRYDQLRDASAKHTQALVSISKDAQNNLSQHAVLQALGAVA